MTRLRNAILAAAALSLLLGPQAHAQTPNPIEGHVINGETAKISDVPWQVALLYPGNSGTFERQFCGGSIIDTEWILTAAHCVVPDPARSTTTSAGAIVVLSGTAELSDKYPGPGNQTEVTRITVHPDYNSETNENDVALLQLETPLDLDASQQPIALGSKPGWPQAGSDALISGWGNTSKTETSYPKQLRKATIEVVSGPQSPACELYPAGEYYPNSMLCAGTPTTGSVDTCQGDSGGPLVVDLDGEPHLAGVTSWGAGCAVPGLPGIYSRVTSYLDWVDATQQNDPGTISVTVEAALPDRAAVCAYAYSTTTLDPEPIAGGCGAPGSKTAAVTGLSEGTYHVLVTSDGKYALPAWWSPRGSQSQRSNAGTVSVAAGGNAKLAASLELGGYIQVNLGKRERDPASDVCVFAYEEGAGESSASACPWYDEAVAVLPRLKPGNYDIEIYDYNEVYPAQWYQGQQYADEANPVEVRAQEGTTISVNVFELVTGPSKVRNLKKTSLAKAGRSYNASFSWSKPLDEGTHRVTKYKVVLRKNGVLQTEKYVTNRSVTATGLARNSRYTIEVAAVSYAGEGESVPLTFTTPKR